ncbi:hypothetical protein [Nocardia sp. NPDC051750]|uniref:hypothetical protein n=1 Tax=Nocardia sp. NPDC051750 TaxID=3364325 RepID=UPI0037BBB69E
MPFSEDNTHEDWPEPEGATLSDGHALTWVDALGQVHLTVADETGNEVEIVLYASAAAEIAIPLAAAAETAAEVEREVQRQAYP